jgi:FkbM family methyltransferase
MFLSNCRKAVDTLAPTLGRSYRILRDKASRRRSIETAYSFTLAGDPAMAAEGWENEEIKTFLELINVHDAVLDIGANVGFYSCLAASRGMHTIAIEPSARNLAFLYRNLWDNRLSSVEIFPVGLAGHCGLGRIYGFGGISSFVRGWAQAGEKQSTLVPLTTLDTIAAGRFQKKKLLIKMDVEGFELDVLSGAQMTLSLNPKPTWLVEILLNGKVIPGGVNSMFYETFEVFWKAGYSSRKLDAARTPVTQADVGRWVANGFVDAETHDFLFSAD